MEKEKTLKEREKRICELALNLRCADCLDEVMQVSSELKDEVNFFEIAKRKNYGSED